MTDPSTTRSQGRRPAFRGSLVLLAVLVSGCGSAGSASGRPSQALVADPGAQPASPEIGAQFGRLVGDWDIRQWRMDSGGTFPEEPSPARWTFRYALDGHAIQDFWIEPPPGDALETGEVRQYGTNLRTYDAAQDRWHIVWTSSDDPRLFTYTATRRGEELVMVGDHEGERPSRIVYFDIQEDSFRWRLEFETADGWLTVSRIEATRR